MEVIKGRNPFTLPIGNYTTGMVYASMHFWSPSGAFKSTVTLIYVIDPYAFTGMGNDFSYGQAEYLEAATREGHDAIASARQVFET